MSDWLTEVTLAAKDSEERETQALHAQSTEELRAAGVPEDNVHQYDLAAMKRDAVPTDGRFSNQYAFEGQRLVGRRDARDGSAMFGAEVEEPDLFDMVPPIGEVETSEAGIVAGGVAHGLKAAAETVAASVYAIPRGIVNFSADVEEAFNEAADPGRWPSYTELGGSPPTGPVDDLARDIVPFFIGFNKVNSAMRALIEGPKKAAAAAGAALDLVLSDPLEGTLLQDAYNAFFSAENDMAMRASMEDFTENNPMAVRGMAALEGAALGVAVDGAGQLLRGLGEKAKVLRQQLFKMADNMEETAAMGLAKSTHAPGVGLDAKGEKWLTVWMASRIMKGQTIVDDALYQAVADTGATQAQVHSAWNAAARQSQQARKQATENWLSEMNERWVLFHGSRHRFSEFDPEKINTGEGTQLEGWGLYLSESEDVADSYRIAGHTIPMHIKRRGYKAEDPTPTYLYTASIDPAERDNLAKWELPANKQKQAPALRRIAKEYELDEDTIDENFDVYYRALQRAVARRTAGEYDMLSPRAAREASRVLRDEAGIKGWTYRENTREAIGYGPDEMGTNVVLTDPSIARIDRREQRKAIRGD